MATHIIAVSGGWQRRIVQTLAEAQPGALTIRQLRFRCGMTTAKDTYGTLMRNIVARLEALGVLRRVGRGLYVLKQEEVA